MVTDSLPSMLAGDVTFHGGWTFHDAPPNHADTPRIALAISFCDADSCFAEDLRLEIVDDLPTISQFSSQGTFMPGAALANTDHPLFTLTTPDTEQSLCERNPK
jgi:hypothetical protein